MVQWTEFNWNNSFVNLPSLRIPCTGVSKISGAVHLVLGKQVNFKVFKAHYTLKHLSFRLTKIEHHYTNMLIHSRWFTAELFIKM